MSNFSLPNYVDSLSQNADMLYPYDNSPPSIPQLQAYQISPFKPSFNDQPLPFYQPQFSPYINNSQSPASFYPSEAPQPADKVNQIAVNSLIGSSNKAVTPLLERPDLSKLDVDSFLKAYEDFNKKIIEQGGIDPSIPNPQHLLAIQSGTTSAPQNKKRHAFVEKKRRDSEKTQMVAIENSRKKALRSCQASLASFNKVRTIMQSLKARSLIDSDSLKDVSAFVKNHNALYASIQQLSTNCSFISNKVEKRKKAILKRKKIKID